MDVVQTKEAVVGIVKLVKFLRVLAADGIDLNDAAALAAKIVQDAEFRGALVAAIEGSAAIPAELKDIKLTEGVELVMAAVTELQSDVRG